MSRKDLMRIGTKTLNEMITSFMRILIINDLPSFYLENKYNREEMIGSSTPVCPQIQDRMSKVTSDLHHQHNFMEKN